MTRLLNVIAFLLSLNCLGGLYGVLGQANAEGEDLLDHVARRLLEEVGDYVHGMPQGSSRGGQSGQGDAQTGHSCSSADVLHGSCAPEGMVCPLAGRHSSYLKCVHSNWLAMPCAPGTMYDMTSKSCASPHDIQPSPHDMQPSPHDFQPSQPDTQPSAIGSQSSQASNTENTRSEAQRPSIQNDSPYGPRLVGFMDFPPPGYPPYHAPGHYPSAGQLGQYSPPAGYPPAALPYQPAAPQAPAPAEKKQEAAAPKPAASNEDGRITQASGQMCKIGTYRAVPGSKKYYEHCIHSGSSSSQWMRRLCPPGMVADEYPVELPCRFSLNFAPPKKNNQYKEQDTKPKTPVAGPQYSYKVPPSEAGVPRVAPPAQISNQPQYVPAKPPVYNKPTYIYYYQAPKKQEAPVHQQNPWNQNRPPYTPRHPDDMEQQESHDSNNIFQNGERVVHNVDPEPYDTEDTNQRAKGEGRRYVDWSSGRQGNVVDIDERANQEPAQPPRFQVVTQLVTLNTDTTTLPTTPVTEATTPVLMQKQPVTGKAPEPPATAPPVPPKPEPKEAPSRKPTQAYPNYLENAEFMKILRDLAAKYIESGLQGKNSTLNDKPTEESVTTDPVTENDKLNVEQPMENQEENAAEEDNDEVPNKENDVIIDFDSGRYELPFVVDMDDLVLWPRDVAAGGEKTEEEKGNQANPFYLLKLPNTAAASNTAAAFAAGLRATKDDS